MMQVEEQVHQEDLEEVEVVTETLLIGQREVVFLDKETQEEQVLLVDVNLEEEVEQELQEAQEVVEWLVEMDQQLL
jgi:hypothetical protein